MLEIDIVTPTRRLVVGAHTPAALLPGERGQLKILPGHAELLTTMSPGILSFAEDGVEKKFAVSYGFAEVRNDKITVLAETAEPAEEVDVERAKTAQTKAEESLKGNLSEADFKKYQFKVQRALIRQQVSK